MAIFWILVASLLLALYNAFLIMDGNFPANSPEPFLTIKKKIKKAWHITGGIIMLFITITACSIWGIKYAPLCFSVFWLLFAGIVHKVGLMKSFFYVGTTAYSDNLLRKYFPNNPERASAVLKISVTLISLLIVFIC